MNKELNFSQPFILKGCYLYNIYFLSQKVLINIWNNEKYKKYCYEVHLLISKNSEAYTVIKNNISLLKKEFFKHTGSEENYEEEKEYVDSMNNIFSKSLYGIFFDKYDDLYYNNVELPISTKLNKNDKKKKKEQCLNYIKKYFGYFIDHDDEFAILVVKRNLFSPNFSYEYKNNYCSKNILTKDCNILGNRPKIYYSKRDDYADKTDDIYELAIENFEALIGTKVDIMLTSNILYNKNNYKTGFYFGGIMLREVNSHQGICDYYYNKKIDAGKVKVDFMLKDNFDDEKIVPSSKDYFAQFSHIFETESSLNDTDITFLKEKNLI